jgi:hypothetical protein
MKIAKTNTPKGGRYNLLMNGWLADNGFSEVTTQERYRIVKIMENLTEVGTWRAGLDDAQRRRLNHPNAIWAHWRRATKPAARPRQRQDVAAEARRGKPIYWPQHSLRRAHEAMLKSRSTDLLVLARLALQAAIRSESDLIELLAPGPIAMSGSPRATDVVSAAGLGPLSAKMQTHEHPTEISDDS